MSRIKALCLAVLSVVTVAHAADRLNPSALSPADRLSLQRQLTAARCYAGPLDGADSDALHAAVQACPDTRPQLRIETGMHIARINRIGVDRACRLAATASDDKTVRLWSLPDGSAGRVLRWPIAQGNGGKAYATAVSPDGKLVAVGGRDARYEITSVQAVTIFDATSGDVVARVDDMPNGISHLAFSHDGRWLAAALGGSSGVRVIDATAWRVVGKDEDYGDQSYGAAFGPDNRLYTASLDGKIRRYAPPPGFARETILKTSSGNQPFSIALNPEGTLLAAGFFGSPVVDIYDARSMAVRGHADTSMIDNGDLYSVAWLSGGGTVLAGGRYSSSGKNPILAFDADGKPAQQSPASQATDAIEDLQPCGRGFIAASGDPAFGFYPRAEGSPLFWTSAVIADLRGALGEAFTVSPDARRVRFGLAQNGNKPVLFDLRTLSLRESPGPQPDFLKPRIAGLPVAKWDDDWHPTLAGKPITLGDFEMSRSLAILPKSRGFALGTDWSLRAYDAKGHPLWPARAVPEVVWGVNASADGRLIVAAYGDGTIRWHRTSDGQELLALFVQRDTLEWVVWTPSGYYVSSTHGEDLIGWHVNRGWDQAADFFPAAKFRDIYARPDIVERVLDTLDEGRAIEMADAARSGPPVEATIVDRQPPVVNVLSPQSGATAVHGEARVAFSLRSPSGLPVDALEAVVDGQPPTRDVHAIDPDLARCLAASIGATCRGALTVYVPSGTSTVSLIAHAGDVTSTLARLSLVNPDPPADTRRTKPRLYVLSIGIAHYDDRSYDLQLADKDATDFAATLFRQKRGHLYDDVEVRPVPDGTLGAIRSGFSWLKSKVGKNDVAMVYFAGHGTLDENQQFYFMAADSHVEDLKGTALSGDEITGLLRDLKGSPVLFLDACHAAASASNAPALPRYNSASVVQSISGVVPRAIIFASSESTETSLEDLSWNNGAFTAALIEALVPKDGKAGADLHGDGQITPSLLDDFLSRAVPLRTNDHQHPKMQKAMESIRVLAEGL